MNRATAMHLFMIIVCASVSCAGNQRVGTKLEAESSRGHSAGRSWVSGASPAALPVRGDAYAVSGGRLIAVGGGEIDDEMARRIIEFAGGPDVNMLIIPFASQRPDAGEESARAWRERGMKRVRRLTTPTDKLESHDDLNAGVSSILWDIKCMETGIREADFIWLPGGDQNRLMNTLNELGLADDIRERFASGAVVGGTSAGAAALSKLMLTGQSKLDRLVVAAGDMADGLGLWPEVIVDQHFFVRQRFNRLLATVLEHRSLVGVGIDEATGVVVIGDALEVFGHGQVLIIDARRSTTEGTGAEPAHEVRGVRVQLLTSGAKWSCKAANCRGNP